MDMSTYTNKRTNRPAWTERHGYMHKVDGYTHMNIYALVLLPTQGSGQNRVNPCLAGGGNPMRVTYE